MIQAAAGHVETQQECVSRSEHGLLRWLELLTTKVPFAGSKKRRN